MSLIGFWCSACSGLVVALVIALSSRLDLPIRVGFPITMLVASVLFGRSIVVGRRLVREHYPAGTDLNSLLALELTLPDLERRVPGAGAELRRTLLLLRGAVGLAMIAMLVHAVLTLWK